MKAQPDAASPEMRHDPVVTERVVFCPPGSPLGASDYRIERHVKKSTACPFCPGNESMTVGETLRLGGGKEWRVRVVPNRYAAVRPDEEPKRQESGFYERMAARGVHEVIIEHTEHHLEMADMSVEDIVLTLEAYRSRWLALRDSGLEYAMIFKNFGAAAGASLEHPHTQLVALPFIPARAQDEFDGASNYRRMLGSCPYCDQLKRAGGAGLEVVRNGSFAVICPEASRFPFEMMILPVKHASDFAASGDAELRDLAAILKDALLRLKRLLNDPPYNFIIHSRPLTRKGGDGFHWHLELIPKLQRTGAFEWGAGFYLNPTPPRIAAMELSQK